MMKQSTKDFLASIKTHDNRIDTDNELWEKVAALNEQEKQWERDREQRQKKEEKELEDIRKGNVGFSTENMKPLLNQIHEQIENRKSYEAKLSELLNPIDPLEGKDEVAHLLDLEQLKLEKKEHELEAAIEYGNENVIEQIRTEKESIIQNISFYENKLKEY